MLTKSHGKTAPRKDADLVVRVARDVRRAFQRRRAPADLDDVAQDAALAAAEALARNQKIDRLGNPMPYLLTAGRRAAGLGVSRALSVVSFPRKHAGVAREWQHRVPVVGCGHAEPEEEGDDGAANLAGSVELDRSTSQGGANAVRRLGAVLVRHVRAMPQADQKVAEVALGLRPGTPSAATEHELAWRTGETPRRVREVMADLTERVGRLRAGWGAMHPDRRDER